MNAECPSSKGRTEARRQVTPRRDSCVCGGCRKVACPGRSRQWHHRPSIIFGANKARPFPRCRDAAPSTACRRSEFRSSNPSRCGASTNPPGTWFLRHVWAASGPRDETRAVVSLCSRSYCWRSGLGGQRTLRERQLTKIHIARTRITIPTRRNIGQNGPTI